MYHIQIVNLRWLIKLNPSNIIVIILDAFRADKILSKYENIYLTPFINKLLEKSIYFNNCIANSTWTLPSHFTMFSGLYEHQNYNLTNSIYELSKKIPLLPEILKDLGYFTFLYTENPHITKEAGLFRGFDINFLNWDLLFKDNILDKVDRYVKAILKKGFWFSFWHKFKTILDRIFKNLNWKRWIRDRYVNPLKKIDSNFQDISLKLTNKPFFFFFNLMVTHAPYLSSQNILQNFGLSISDFKHIKHLLLYPLENFININLNSKHLSENEILILNKLYDSSVYYCDWIIKHIFLKLEKYNMLDNTYVIITSDHGELLGSTNDHYYWTHGVFHSVYEPLIKIPLLIYNNHFESKTVNNQVELKDIFHTILHLTGISENNNKYLKIKNSLMKQIDTNSTPKYIFGEFLKDKYEMLNRINYHRRQVDEKLIPKLLSNIYFLRSEKYKLISYGNQIDELFDILKDPNETFNLINIENKKYQEMKLTIRDFLNRMKDKEELTNLINIYEKQLINKAVSNIRFK
ncbi:MAG: sulfatase-like hydrolase/transferase [Candidatus Odinarchaeota archaeon]